MTVSDRDYRYEDWVLSIKKILIFANKSWDLAQGLGCVFCFLFLLKLPFDKAERSSRVRWGTFSQGMKSRKLVALQEGIEECSWTLEIRARSLEEGSIQIRPKWTRPFKVGEKERGGIVSYSRRLAEWQTLLRDGWVTYNSHQPDLGGITRRWGRAVGWVLGQILIKLGYLPRAWVP